MQSALRLLKVNSKRTRKMCYIDGKIWRSARKSKMERIKNEYIKEIMGVKGKPDIIEKKRLQ
jgi:hypothetical protein